MYTWSNKKEFKAIAADIEKAGESFDVINKADAVYNTSIFTREPVSAGNNIRVRSNINRADWNYYRSAEKIPDTIQESISISDKIYREVSVVRSTIDMMGDFTTESIRVQHRDPNIQSVLDDWMEFIDFHGTNERIANTLYRLGNVPVQITYGTVPSKKQKEWEQSKGDAIIVDNKTIKNRIPLKYDIIHPNSIKQIGGKLSSFIGKPIYGFMPDDQFVQDIKRMYQEKQKFDKDELKVIPDEMIAQLIDGQGIIPIHPEKLEILFYKKDDWNEWAWPMIHSIMKAVYRLEKMHLADDKALDGAISQIRLWTLGSFEHEIYPNAAAINKLRNILANIGSGDVMDLIWGPELTFQESNSNAYNWLKADKYSQVMTEIYAGLGVPPSLTGAGDNNAGFSNNSVSMKTLVERLQYVRKILIRFWNKELKKIQKAFGWRYTPQVVFDRKIVLDEQFERKFILDAWDRSLISDERFRELADEDPVLERIRTKKEYRSRENGTLPPKASPYHDADWKNVIKKQLIQNGGVAPSEVGVELKKKKDGEKTKMEQEAEMKEKENKEIVKEKQKGVPGEGRPLGKKDEQPRQKNVTPRTAAFVDNFIWANAAQEIIADILSPVLLQRVNKRNLRQLTKNEVSIFEDLKFLVLNNLEPQENVSQARVLELCQQGMKYNSKMIVNKEILTKIFKEKNGSLPSTTELRQIQSTAFAAFYET